MVDTWPELLAHIVLRDLGAERATRLATAMSQAGKVLRSWALAPSEISPTHCDPTNKLTLQLTPGGVWLEGRAGRVFVAHCSGAVNSAALRAELCRRSEPRGCVGHNELHADPHVAYGDVTAVVDQLVEAGFGSPKMSSSSRPAPTASAAETAPAACGREPVNCTPPPPTTGGPPDPGSSARRRQVALIGASAPAPARRPPADGL